MPISSIEDLANDLDIDLDSGDSYTKPSVGSKRQQGKISSVEDLAASMDIPLNEQTSPVETIEKPKRGILDWLTTGEYFGVGVARQNMEAAQRLLQDPTTSGKLEAAYELFGLPGWKTLPAGVRGVQEQSTLAGTIEEKTGTKLSTGERFAADIGQIFLDPTLYFSLGLSKLPKYALKLGKETPVIGKPLTKAADYVGEKFIFQYKAPTDYIKRSAERLVRIAGGQEAAEKMAKSLTRIPGKKFGKFGRKLTLEEQRTLGDIITGQITNADPTLVRIAEPAIQALEQLGKDAVETGLMSTDTFLQRAGQYMPRLYRKHELTDRLARFSARDTKIKGERFLARQDLTKEAMQAKGLIEEAAYPVAKGIRDLTYDIETAKWLKWIDGKYAKVADDLVGSEIDEFVQLGDSKGLGDLAGKYVPKFVADDVNKLFEPVKDWVKKYNRALNYWKVGKTVLNPGYHVRNFMSNFILNDLNGVNVLSLKGGKAYTQALKELKEGGQYLDEAKEAGLLGKTFYGEDLKDFIDPLDKKTGEGIASWMKNAGKFIADKGGKFQSLNEDMSKLANFIYHRTAGESVEEAVTKANKALFDYGALTKFEEKIKKFIPFYTFNRKAWPMITQIAIDSPGKIGKYSQLKTAVENLSPESEEERRWLPSWMRDQFVMRLPMKDKEGRSMYFDLTYIVPYGDVVATSSRGGLAGIARQITLMMTPFAKEAIEQGLGKDFYFDQDIELFRNQKLFGTIPTDTRLAHALRTFAPTIYTEVADKLLPALRGDKDYAGRDISVPSTLGSMFGFKTYKFDKLKAMKSLPYDLGQQIEGYDQNIYRAKNDQSLTDEERIQEIDYWTKKRQKVLDRYPGVTPKKRIWIDGER